MKKLLFFFLISAALSCADTKLTNNDRGNYRYRILDAPRNKIEVNVTVLPMPVIPKKEIEKEKTFFDLRDSIPHKYLSIISKDSNANQEILEMIRAPLSNSPKQKSAISETSKVNVEDEVQIRFLFSNIKKYYNDKSLMHPNTRLEIINTKLTMNDKHFKIISIDKIENEFETIDLGTIERNQEVKFLSKLTGEGSVGIDYIQKGLEESESNNLSTNTGDKNIYDSNGNVIGKYSDIKTSNENTKNSKGQDITAKNSASGNINLEYANAETIKEALSLKFRKAKTSFAFTPKSILLSQKGNILSDISDNVIISATLKLDDTDLLSTSTTFEFKELINSSTNEPNGVKDIVLVKRFNRFIDCKKVDNVSLDFQINYDGAIRAVRNLKRGRNSLEYDDKVDYYRFSDSIKRESAVQIDLKDHCNRVYNIMAMVEGETSEYILYIKPNLKKEEDVWVYTYYDIVPLISWIHKLILKNDPAMFSNPSFELYFRHKDDESKKVYLAKNVFQESDLIALKKLKYIDKYDWH